MHVKESKPLPYERNESGSVVAILPAVIVIAVIGLGAIGLDVAHNVTTRTAEQSATDAAALAGVSYVVQNNIGSNSGLGTSPPVGAMQIASLASGVSGNAQTTAVSVAGNNTADGKRVSTAGGATVTTTVSAPSSSTSASTPYPGNNGECQVNSSMPIRNMFSSIIGRPTDVVPVQSNATGYTTVVGVDANQLFPIAVSLDSTNGHSTTASDNNLPLAMCTIGTQTAFTLEEPCANAAWTTFNALKSPTAYPSETNQLNWINAAIAPYTGSSFATGVTVPAQLVGEKNSQGTQPTGSAYPAAAYQAGGIDLWASVSNPTNFSSSLPLTVNLPVIAGDQPFRQTTTNTGVATGGSGTTPYGPQTHPLLGFIGFKITNAVYGADGTTGATELQYIQGTIVKTLVKGIPGVANPTILPSSATVPQNSLGATTVSQYNNAMDLALQNLSPGLVMLGVTNLNVGPSSQPAGSTGVGPSGPIPVANTSGYYSTGPKVGTTAYEDVSKSRLAGLPVATTQGSSYSTDIGGTSLTYTAGTQISTYPGTTGKPRVEPNLGGITPSSGVVYATATALPNTPMTITMYFTDETGLSLIGGISEWTQSGMTNLGSSGITYTVNPAPPNPGYTSAQTGWTLPAGFTIDTYISQVTINVPALTSPVVLQVDSVDSDRSGDTGLTLIDVQFPSCPLPVS